MLSGMFDPLSPSLPLERIARLEAGLKHEREMRERDASLMQSTLGQNVHWLNHRITKLERDWPSQSSSDRKALLKVSLGVALPLAVYLLTGSHTLALKAASAVIGAP